MNNQSFPPRKTDNFFGSLTELLSQKCNSTAINIMAIPKSIPLLHH